MYGLYTAMKRMIYRKKIQTMKQLLKQQENSIGGLFVVLLH